MKKKLIPFALLFSYLLPLVGCGPKSYTITFDPNNGEDVFTIVVEGGTLLEEPESPSKAAYDFVSWRYNNVKWSFKYETVKSDMTLVASYKPITYDITYDLSEFDGYIAEKNKTNYPDEYTIESKNVLGDACCNGYNFSHWEDQNGNVVSKLGGIYGDLTLKAKFTVKDNFILFGEYPNHVVKDNALSDELDKIQDKEDGDIVEYNGKKYEKRIFDKNPLSYQTRIRNFQIGKAYYFEYEPILWRIVKSNDSVMTLISEYILFHAENGFGPTTNYAESYVREELNGVFYNSAFSDDEKSRIFLTGLDVYEDVYYKFEEREERKRFADIADKVFIPTYEELTDTVCGFAPGQQAKAYATEYAICDDVNYQTNEIREYGWNYLSRYFLRNTYRREYSTVQSTCYFNSIASDGNNDRFYLDTKEYGVRPMIMLRK